MSLGSSDMAGGALGTAFSLLLLASITQGIQHVEVFHYEKLEAVVGQNVTLPCTINASSGLKIVSMEWSKNKNEKLALYGRGLGFHLFWPNVTMQNTSNGSYLHLFNVQKWDSGVYICDTATFPLGSIRRETVLEIKDDVQILCDVNSTVEVHAGDNVTIQCKAFPDARYKWTKNKMLVSENESLGLWCVTDAHTGVYTLTVNTGNKSLHKEFIITVLAATTSLRTGLQHVEVFHYEKLEGVVGQNVTLPCTINVSSGLKIVSMEWGKNKNEKLALYGRGLGFHLFWPNITMQNTSNGSYLHLFNVQKWDSGVYICDTATFPLGSIRRETVLEIKDLVTVPPHSNVTEEGLIESADGGLTTSPTTELSTRSPDGAAYIPNSTEHTTSLTNLTRISVTSSPATHTDHYHFNSSSDQQINFTRNTFSDQSVHSNTTTTLSYGDKVTRSTQDKRNESTRGSPGENPTLSTEIPVVIEDEDTGAVRSHLLLVLIIVPILVLIALAGFLYRRQIIRERMDLPPPFKPPPPPVKYTSARHHEIQQFPTSRCNSVTELKDMKQMFINI